MRKAIVDQVMLSLFIFIILIVFGATVGDEIKKRTEVEKLRTIIQNAALSSGKYYMNVNKITDDAEAAARSIASKSKLGAKIKDDMEFIWEPDESNPETVRVRIENYQVDYFWYKYIGVDSTLATLEAKADLGEPVCACGDEAGVSLTADGILCIVGTDYLENVQVSEDGTQWKVVTEFNKGEPGEWKEEEWYAAAAVNKVYVILQNGDDYVQLGALNEETIVDGGCGDDYIEGSDNAETIYGNKGNDDIQGNSGNDIIYGGYGIDEIQAGNGNDTVYTDGSDNIQDAETIESGDGYNDDCSNPGSIRFDCTGGEVKLVY